MDLRLNTQTQKTLQEYVVLALTYRNGASIFTITQTDEINLLSLLNLKNVINTVVWTISATV